MQTPSNMREITRTNHLGKIALELFCGTNGWHILGTTGVVAQLIWSRLMQSITVIEGNSMKNALSFVNWEKPILGSCRVMQQIGSRAVLSSRVIGVVVLSMEIVSWKVQSTRGSFSRYGTDPFFFVALIQLIAASQARRPLTYAAYGDRQLVLGFNDIYSYLLDNGATVADVYNYLRMYSQRKDLRTPVFEMIKKNPIGDTRF